MQLLAVGSFSWGGAELESALCSPDSKIHTLNFQGGLSPFVLTRGHGVRDCSVERERTLVAQAGPALSPTSAASSPGKLRQVTRPL